VSDATIVWSTAGAVILSFGGGGVLVFALSSWLGKVWATRIADAERARFSKELENYKSDLQHLSEERRDALTRKRDVYAQVATSMRVFLAVGRRASDDEKREFLVAFDQATLWGSEDVVKTLAHSLEQSTRNTAEPGSVSNDEFKNAYRACMIAMRRDCRIPRYDVPLSRRYLSLSSATALLMNI
jgi:hypothetical protein